MNQFFFNGRLGQDGVMRYTQDGKAVMELSIAITRKVREEYVASWIRATLWERTAEIWAPWCKKGVEVVVSGDVIEQKWTDKDSGQPRSALKVNASFFRVVVSRKGEAAESVSDANEDGGPNL